VTQYGGDEPSATLHFGRGGDARCRTEVVPAKVGGVEGGAGGLQIYDVFPTRCPR
jgi:hypothetical protein